MSGFLEKYDYHYVFSIEPNFEGPPTLPVFRKFTSEEFMAAMVNKLNKNIASADSEDGPQEQNDAYKALQEELQMMKIRSMYNKCSPLLCIHSNKDLSSKDISDYIEGVESVDGFIKETKLDL
ncbi:MAG: hypothetical protein KAS32_02750 [Candidatus Peribacteraceae bacterium]|nr:hypothetical protein [Candidatus Peribacteraceae bacterium]